MEVYPNRFNDLSCSSNQSKSLLHTEINDSRLSVRGDEDKDCRLGGGLAKARHKVHTVMLK